MKKRVLYCVKYSDDNIAWFRDKSVKQHHIRKNLNKFFYNNSIKWVKAFYLTDADNQKANKDNQVGFASSSNVIMFN